MKRSLQVLILLFCCLLTPILAAAGPIKAHVAEFAVSPAPPEAEALKTTLQRLLFSRLESDEISTVSAPSDADVLVTGSYTQLGKVFSLDAVAKLPSGKKIASAFDQGESADDLIPALGRISAKLKAAIVKNYRQAPAQAAAAPVASASAPAPAAFAAPAPAASAPTLGQTAWLSQRLPGAQIALAPAVSGAAGTEVFLAEDHAVRLYRQEKTLKLLAQAELALKEKVVGIDSTGPDATGAPCVFVSIMDGDLPASKVFRFQDGKLKLVASKIPYLFRAIALAGGQRKMYAQEIGLTDADYFGDLYEATLVGDKVEVKNPIKLPLYANLFNYNRFQGADGKSYSVVLNSDGYLVVFSDAGEEIWRSTEKVGGSETFFERSVGASRKADNGKNRWRFLDQRVTVTPDGQIIVPQNGGFFVVGDFRSYSNYALVSYTWSGTALEERWRTKTSQNYLADYYLDPAAREFVLLEVVQKAGLFRKAAAAVRAIKAD